MSKKNVFSEEDMISFISKRVGKIKNKKIITGIGDDCAVLDYDSKQYMIITTDSIVENVHFKRKWFSAEQIGRKAVEINVSDIASMGGEPTYATVSIQSPSTMNESYFKKMYNGIFSACKRYAISIVGGNITKAKELSISITLVGFVEKKRLRLRSGAKKGDLICITGTCGKTHAALELLNNGKNGSSVPHFLNLRAKLKEGRLLSQYAHAMEDNTDGLGATINHICKQSKVGAHVFQNAIPVAKEVSIDSKKLSKKPIDYALWGEYLDLVFTISPRKLEVLKGKKIAFTVIGNIVGGKKEIVLFDGENKKKLPSEFDHFK